MESRLGYCSMRADIYKEYWNSANGEILMATGGIMVVVLMIVMVSTGIRSPSHPSHLQLVLILVQTFLGIHFCVHILTGTAVFWLFPGIMDCSRLYLPLQVCS